MLAVGDAQFQEKCLKKLNYLSSHGRTVLFVSHNIGSILSLCNKGIFLEKGQINTIGTIDQCINAYMLSYQTQALAWSGDEGDDHVRFYKATLSSSQGNRDFFYQEDKVRIDIEYEVLKTTQNLILGIGIWDQRGHLLAHSHTWDDVDHFNSITIPGKVHASFQLDASFFYEGDYIIKVDCFIHNKKRVLSDEIVLKFPVYTQKKNTHLTHSIAQEGVFLGNRWKVTSQKNSSI